MLFLTFPKKNLILGYKQIIMLKTQKNEKSYKYLFLLSQIDLKVRKTCCTDEFDLNTTFYR